MPSRTVISATQSSNSAVNLQLGNPDAKKRTKEDEEFEVDYVFTATGYVRNAHESMLSEVKNLLPASAQQEGKFRVGRDYRVSFEQGKVDDNAGVWLQGCNEGTHGVSLSFFLPRHEYLC